jgi:hypothetical protein
MKRFFYLFFVLMFSSIVHAQFELGIKAGYNSSLGFNNLSMIGDKTYTIDNVKSEMWNNFHAGAFARIFIDKFYLQPEVLYSIQRKNYDLLDVVLDGTATDVESYMEINTVQVPLYLGYKLLDLRIARLRMFTGPKFILNAGSSLEYKNITTQQMTSAKLAEDFKNSQVDIEFGAGLDVLMFALEAKVNLIQDVGSKFKSGDANLKVTGMPTSNFVISLAWNLF